MSRLPLPGLEVNQVVAASAGTGKTYLLSELYLALVLGLGSERVAADRIVATTFSRAAAREIRERLAQRLSVVAGGQNLERDLGPRLLGLSRDRGIGGRELSARAERALGELPRTLIDTLHGLCARVLRAHGPELGVHPGFSVLEEPAARDEAETVLEEVLSEAALEGRDQAESVRTLLDIGQGLDLTKPAVLDLTSVLDEEGVDADQLGRADHVADAEAIRATLIAAADRVLAAGPAHALHGAAQRVRAAAGQTPLDPKALTEGLVVLFKPNRPKLQSLPGGPELVHALDALLTPSDSRARARQIAATVAFFVRAPHLMRVEAELAALIGRHQRALRDRHRTRGALGFGDLLRLARDGLRDHPDVASRVASEIDFLLVDEFQDTSRVQRDLILLLREDPERARQRSKGSLPTPASLCPRGLFLVGDRKQSIYAFRGADVSVYARLAAELAGEAAARALDLRGVEPVAEPVAEFETLTRNHRSGSAILAFVNQLSGRDFGAEPQHSFEIRQTDAELLVPAATAGDPGRVTLLFDDGASPEDAEAIVREGSPSLRTAFLVAGFCVRARREGQKLSDIAVLARRRATLPLLALALDRVEVPFVVAGRELYATPEIRDLAALLRAALDPLDRRALSVVARSPLGGLSDRTLAALSRPTQGLLPAARWVLDDSLEPGERERARELSDRLLELGGLAPRLSARDTLSFAVERFELPRVLSSLSRGASRLGNVIRLLDIASHHGGSVPLFTRFLEHQIALDVDEPEAVVFSEEDDAIRLLTIHGSKGLSFPTTIVVDLDSVEVSSRRCFDLLRADGTEPELFFRHRGPDGGIPTKHHHRHKDISGARARAERRRLSYVALTRAERELVLVVPDGPPRQGSLHQTLDSMLTEEPASALSIRRLGAAEVLSERGPPPGATPEPSAPPPRPGAPRVGLAAVGATALSDFATCPRRFQLLHVLGLEEPTAPGLDALSADDPRSLGSAAHRVLERFPLQRWGGAVAPQEIVGWLAREGLDPEAGQTGRTADGIARFLSGSFARGARDAPRVFRELELNVALARPEPVGRDRARRQLELFASRPGPSTTVVLKATLDLLVERTDGSMDIVDYKRTTRSAAGRYDAQLAAYRLAVERRFGSRPIRTGLLHLLGEPEKPEWLEPAPLDLFPLAEDLVHRRYDDDYPPVLPTRCRLARCGFLHGCHGPNPTRRVSGSAETGSGPDPA